MRLRRFASLICAVVFFAAAQASESKYPDHPIRLVVPSGAGGITDLLARVVGAKLGSLLDTSIVVENKPGASGVIGSEFVAKARPDGYTLLFAFPTHVANPTTIKSLPYDTVKDFAPIAKIGLVSTVLLVSNNGGIDSVKTLIAKAKAGKGAVSYGSVGTGSQGDLCALVFANQAGVKMLSVPYKSEPEMVTALIRNDIQFVFASPPVALPMIKSGQVRALAISSSTRSPSLPDLPTVAQSGLPGYDTTGWNAIFAPAKTPAAIIATLNKAINQALKDPGVVKQFVAFGVPPLGGTPEQLRLSVARDIATIHKTLTDIGYVAQ